MQCFYEDCKICFNHGKPDPEKCFDCARAEPSVSGLVHSLGIYYPRREKKNRYGRSKWSQGIIRLKHKYSSMLSVFGTILSCYLERKLYDYDPYIIANVPGSASDSGSLFPETEACPVRLLVLSAYSRLKRRKQVSINSVLEQVIPKQKKQHHCSTDTERFGNVRGIYAVKDQQQIRGKRIVLVDDVLTSGATINECSKTLLKAGAQKVIGIVLAKTHRT